MAGGCSARNIVETPSNGGFSIFRYKLPKPNAYPIKSLAYFLPKNIRHQFADAASLTP